MFKRILKKRSLATRRAARTRARIRGTAARPRLTVYRSLKHISAQIIDDSTGRTLAASTDKHVNAEGKKPVEIAALVGADVAEKAKKAGVTAIVFDRGSYKYHGRVAALAEAAREAGLIF